MQVGPPLQRLNFGGFLDHIRASTVGLLHKIATPASSVPLQWAKSMVENSTEGRAPYCRRHVDCMESGEGDAVAEGVAGGDTGVCGASLRIQVFECLILTLHLWDTSFGCQHPLTFYQHSTKDYQLYINPK